jgi:hypothetical protein
VLLLLLFAVLWVAVVGCRCLAGSHDDLVGAKAKEEDLAPKVRKRQKRLTYLSLTRTNVLIFPSLSLLSLLFSFKDPDLDGRRRKAIKAKKKRKKRERYMQSKEEAAMKERNQRR